MSNTIRPFSLPPIEELTAPFAQWTLQRAFDEAQNAIGQCATSRVTFQCKGYWDESVVSTWMDPKKLIQFQFTDATFRKEVLDTITLLGADEQLKSTDALVDELFKKVTRYYRLMQTNNILRSAKGTVIDARGMGKMETGISSDGSLLINGSLVYHPQTSIPIQADQFQSPVAIRLILCRNRILCINDEMFNRGDGKCQCFHLKTFALINRYSSNRPLYLGDFEIDRYVRRVICDVLASFSPL